jgi:hypothetical protein
MQIPNYARTLALGTILALSAAGRPAAHLLAAAPGDQTLPYPVTVQAPAAGRSIIASLDPDGLLLVFGTGFTPGALVLIGVSDSAVNGPPHVVARIVAGSDGSILGAGRVSFCITGNAIASATDQVTFGSSNRVNLGPLPGC